MPRGDNLPRFGEKADQMRRRARQIRERNAQRAQLAEPEKRQADG
jgi:hypothetical protein